MSKIFSQVSLLTVLFFFAGCATSELATESPSSSEITENEVIPDVIPENWHLQSVNGSPYYGTGVEQVYSSLLINRSPQKEVVVAIIDSGTDIEHEDLKGNIWVNKDEIAGNGIDDDNNGYVDDVHGWNFIGNPDGESVEKDTYEVTRLYVKLDQKYSAVHPDSLSASELQEYEFYQTVKQDFEERIIEAEQGFMNFSGFYQVAQYAKGFFGVDDLQNVNPEELIPQETDTPELGQLKQVATIMQENDLSEEDILEGVEYYEGLYQYGLNPEFEPRGIVGDDYEDLSNRFYGNNDVAGVHNEHGTHVAGIVGAIRDNNLGINGIADVKLMIIRAVPDGDERDKDVANSIRYAAENGADIINMSFGKGYSPQKHYVDEAVKFADSLGVLMIHAAGNDGNDIDTTNNFPSRYYLDGGEAQNWMNIGASSWKTDQELPASFSNFGKTKVDLFAPGVDIFSTVPSNEYEANDGTSMAAPVVTGIAALLMSYYPDLSASEIKEILINSVTIPEIVHVVKPGSIEEPITKPFSDLSITGGIVNAYNAVNLVELRTPGDL